MSKYPFNREEELKDVGTFPAMPVLYRGGIGQPIRRFNTPITPKENLLRIFKKEMPLWAPNMDTDINMLQPLVFPDASARVFGGIDCFGIDWKFEPTAGAAMVRPGTRRLSDITEWENELTFMNVFDLDWEKDYKENYANCISPDRATGFVIVNGCFERLADLTSFEDCLCSLLTEPEAVNAFFDRLTDWHIDLCRIAKEVYGADFITFHDDMGTQRSSFISPDTYEEMLLPHHKRMNDAIHKMGMYTNYHSCGNVGNLLDKFIEAGFDTWEGQSNANNKAELMDKYGDRLGQFTGLMIDENTTDEQAEEFIDNIIKTEGKTGRMVLTVRDLKEGRVPNTAEIQYVKSREFYSSL